MNERFDTIVTCSLQEIYRCNGIDGFDDLIVDKLGHDIEDATFEVVGYGPDNLLMIRVRGIKHNEGTME